MAFTPATAHQVARELRDLSDHYLRRALAAPSPAACSSATRQAEILFTSADRWDRVAKLAEDFHSLRIYIPTQARGAALSRFEGKPLSLLAPREDARQA